VPDPGAGALERGASAGPEGAPAASAAASAVCEAAVQRQAVAAFAAVREPAAVVGADGRVVLANAAMAALCSVPASACRGLLLAPALGLPGPWPPEEPVAWDFTAPGSRRTLPLQLECRPLDDGPGGCLLAQVRDMSDRRLAERVMQRLAWNDTLTGLPNRAAVSAHVATRAAAHPVQPFALLLLQLEGLQSLIQWLGQGAADEAVTALAQRLQAALPDGFVGRWDGRRFVALLETDSEGAALQHQVLTLAQGLARLLPGRVGALRLTVGAVRCPADAEDADALLDRAAAALQSVPAAAEVAVSLYEPAMQQALKRTAGLEAALRADLDAGRLYVMVQPKTDRHRRHTGAELLMRWDSDAYGTVLPDEFIPLAERTGLIGRIGELAMRRAASLTAELQALPEAHTPRLAVNVSPYQLLQQDLPRQLQACCEQAGVLPSAIELELTESALATGPDHVAALLRELRQHGFQLALDDFGSEYSSLRHLRELPFQKVKIDRSFLQRLETDPASHALLRGMVSLCAGVGLRTVVEGVETAAQFQRLVSMGVHEFQGYWISRPIPPAAWLEQLRSGAVDVAGPARGE
jgi:diguanylate cyclase (GGDEF)-like protein